MNRRGFLQSLAGLPLIVAGVGAVATAHKAQAAAAMDGLAHLSGETVKVMTAGEISLMRDSYVRGYIEAARPIMERMQGDFMDKMIYWDALRNAYTA